MRIVVALGGNALLQRGEPPTAKTQRLHAAAAAEAIAALAREHEILVTHGNGPQVGLLALQAAAFKDVEPYPLDVLGAESEGMIGYVLEQELANRLPDRAIATLLTQIVVDARDPAFDNPTKPIGEVYTEGEALAMQRAEGWSVARDNGFFRRVVPSPRPVRIVALRAIGTLVDSGVLVVCAGGGGIPVVEDADRTLRGVEAVIDKDFAGELLARSLGADYFLMLTDVSGVFDGWGTPGANMVSHATPERLRAIDFARGSMGPKVEAACLFVEATGNAAGIGALEDASAIVAGKAGTTIRPGA